MDGTIADGSFKFRSEGPTVRESLAADEKGIANAAATLKVDQKTLDNLSTATTIATDVMEKALENLKNLEIVRPGEIKGIKQGKEGVGNPWFKPTALISYMENFMEMLAMLSQIKAAEKQLDVTSMNRIIVLAEKTAEFIKLAAHEEAKKHYTQAIVSGIQGAVAIGTAVATFAPKVGARAKAKDKHTKVETQLNDQLNDLKTQKGVLSGVGSPSTGEERRTKLAQLDVKIGDVDRQVQQHKMNKENFIQQEFMNNMMAFNLAKEATTSFVNMGGEIAKGVFTERKAEYDAMREILSAAQTMARKSGEMSADEYKAMTELIAKLIEAVKAMASQLYQTFSTRA